MANPELTGTPSDFDRKAHSLARRLGPHTPHRMSTSRKLARGLGWFSIGLGLVELLAAESLARAVGLRGNEVLLRAYGVREIANGLAILGSRGPGGEATGVWARVVGDGIDIATLTAAVLRPDPPNAHPLPALLAVAGITAVDMVCAQTLGHEAHAARQTTDYRQRSGLRGRPEEARGIALRTFTQPDDMRASPRANGSHLSGESLAARPAPAEAAPH